jgi:hypothetical protein
LAPERAHLVTERVSLLRIFAEGLVAAAGLFEDGIGCKNMTLLRRRLRTNLVLVGLLRNDP